MQTKDSIDLWRKREYVVSKSNIIIQQSRYSLSMQEQKALAYICSLIKPTDTTLTYEFNILDFCAVLGITHSGKNYSDIKRTLKNLVSKVMWLKLDNDTETTVNWLSKVYINKHQGICKIILDNDLAPYLLNLREKFLSYGLYNVLALRSKYSLRLYELLKSYLYLNNKTFKIDELKELLMLGSSSSKSYSEFKVFNRNIIKKSINEINELTDLYVTYNTIKIGHFVSAINFTIKEKTNLDKTLTFSKLEKILDNK